MSRLEQLKSTRSLADFASLMGYKQKSIAFILYKIPDSEKYYEFKIPKKSGGSRIIESPIKRLKLLQKRLSILLNDCYEEITPDHKNHKSLAHGFRKNHSIITNAINHKNRRYVFNIDLLDFFPSINFGRVRGFFINNDFFKLDPSVATIIAQIACHNNHLPQGSPCSPILSNLIGHILDIRMVKLAKKAKCTYSRYVDDLTFSTNKKDFPNAIAVKIGNNNWKPAEPLKEEIENAGFFLNPSKTSMQYKTSRQTTTGLVVNKKVNIQKEYYKNARACCHELFTNNSFYFKGSLELSSITDTQGKEPGDINVRKISQLGGVLNFIYTVKRNYDKEKAETRKRHPNSITKLYRQFLFYKHFYILKKPLLICEGKTDIAYLKVALKNLHHEFGDLIIKTESGFEYLVHFLKYSKCFKDVFAISEGTSGMQFIMQIFSSYVNLYKSDGMPYPVIMVFDTDSGIKEILKMLKIKDFSRPFLKFTDNLYVTFISKKKDLKIEDLFEKDLLDTKIDGKTFNPDNTLDIQNEYGKQIFVERVVKPNQTKINFSGFLPLLNNIRLIIRNHDAET